MNRSIKAIALGATALAAGLVTVGAYAQSPDVITVTAQKREQTLQETPVSVAVVTDQAITEHLPRCRAGSRRSAAGHSPRKRDHPPAGVIVRHGVQRLRR